MCAGFARLMRRNLKIVYGPRRLQNCNLKIRLTANSAKRHPEDLYISKLRVQFGLDLPEASVIPLAPCVSAAVLASSLRGRNGKISSNHYF